MTIEELPARPKLESNFPIIRNPCPLVVWDFNVAVFHVINWLEKTHLECSPEVHKKIIRAAFAVHINRGPSMLPRFSHRAIFVYDNRFKHTGNYWRNEVMRESTVVQQAWVDHAEREKVDYATLPKEYKGTRSEKSDNFWFVYNECRDYAEQYFPFFGEEGYEADDFAGAVYRLSRDSDEDSVVKKRQILLATLDRDWSQCVDEAHQIYFANTRIPFSKEKIQERLVANQGVIEHTKHRMGYDISHPAELAEHKVLHSDMGDNLPKGTPKDLFDLCEPHPDYNIDLTPSQTALIEECNNDQANDRPDHFEKGLRAIATVGLEAPTII